MPAGWEDRASQWLARARTPGHDAYWRYPDAFFALVPPPVGRTLEVGCGEVASRATWRHAGTP